jgi:hypothetical protein
MKVLGRCGNQGANMNRSLEMKRIFLATLLAGCTGNADIGMSNQPVTCKPDAEGAAHGTLTNTYTNKSYSFGTVATSLVPTPGATTSNVQQQDSLMLLRLDFSCGTTDLGMYDVGAGQQACPLLVNSTVSASNQAVYGLGTSGIVIVDQNTSCLAGRYDVTFTSTAPTGGGEANGEVTGWFSVPLQ